MRNGPLEGGFFNHALHSWQNSIYETMLGMALRR